MAAPKVTTFSKPSGDDKTKGSQDDERKLPIQKKMFLLDKRTSKEAIPSTRLSYYEYIDMEVQRALDIRDYLKIEETIDGEVLDVTPKPIEVPYDTEGYKKLKQKVSCIQKRRGDSGGFKGTASSILRAKSSRGVGFHLSMEDIVTGIGSERMLTDLRTSTAISPYIDISSSSSSSSIEDKTEKDIKTKFNLPFIRVVLRKTELILLYEQQSMTAIKNTEDGNYAEKDNKEYDYLTIGKGKVRRRSDAETQTNDSLFKSRKVNTIRKDTTDTGSYVSYFEMFDTYRKLEEVDPFALEDQEDKTEKENITKLSREQQFAAIVKLPSFHWASTVLKRLLAGNNFETAQRRFRNMDSIPLTISNINYKYSLQNLFTIQPYAPDNERRAVSDMSFCYSNSDILAVSYGIYSYQAAKLPSTGEVCIWSIKNPCDPERYYFYNYPVVALEFSPYMPNLLAIGLFDGSIEVRDISKFSQPPVAISQRSSSPGVDPVLAIKWIKQGGNSDDDGVDDIDPFLSLSQDGSVTRFHIIRGPYLLGNKQMSLERIEGKPEGLPVTVLNAATQEANPRPQCLNLTKHPLHADIYYILTDEGCLHKCSTNYQHHYLEVLKTHKGAVNCMDFSPWSPKLFLTCGNDWFIRIWMEGIFKPLITLQNMYGPYQWAGWSRTHSTILIALNRKQCEIWDLKRSTLKPVSVHKLGSSYNTLALFSRDGNSIAIGNERGKVFLLAYEEMPFAPHYQYDALEKAIFNAVNNFPELLIELKSLGYFGYPNKGMVIPP
ncbi:dynein axonemal intermediate chain 4-like [Musca vetustissima]|uniref:dynein axonemal intermediate chain 4-like n=1 Tax=Musca vetustissima TaxID=27455 RepID=UPI002AB6DE22|nr:dynein axonemal intermediate chain 4-like [Musca vetustissima]